MTPFERLYEETTEARERFLAIPLVKHAVATGGTREMYLALPDRSLSPRQTYLPASCRLPPRGPATKRYQTALFDLHE